MLRRGTTISGHQPSYSLTLPWDVIRSTVHSMVLTLNTLQTWVHPGNLSCLSVLHPTLSVVVTILVVITCHRNIRTGQEYQSTYPNQLCKNWPEAFFSCSTQVSKYFY